MALSEQKREQNVWVSSQRERKSCDTFEKEARHQARYENRDGVSEQTELCLR